VSERLIWLLAGAAIGALLVFLFFWGYHRRSPLYGWITMTYQARPGGTWDAREEP
jgi:hypothetical protein